MKTAGVREARQNLSSLIEEVRKGRDVLLTEHGRPVARLVSALPEPTKPFKSHKRFRATIHVKGNALSEAIAEDREDRI